MPAHGAARRGCPSSNRTESVTPSECRPRSDAPDNVANDPQVTGGIDGPSFVTQVLARAEVGQPEPLRATVETGRDVLALECMTDLLVSQSKRARGDDLNIKTLGEGPRQNIARVVGAPVDVEINRRSHDGWVGEWAVTGYAHHVRRRVALEGQCETGQHILLRTTRRSDACGLRHLCHSVVPVEIRGGDDDLVDEQWLKAIQ